MTKAERKERAMSKASERAKWFLTYRSDLLKDLTGTNVRMTSSDDPEAPLQWMFLPAYEVNGRPVPQPSQGSEEAHIRLAFANALDEMARRELRRETMHQVEYKSIGVTIYIWSDLYNWGWAIVTQGGKVVRDEPEENFLLENIEQAYHRAVQVLKKILRSGGMHDRDIKALEPSELTKVVDPIREISAWQMAKP